MKTFEKPLSAQEEKELLIELHNGNSAARNVLIEKNMRLVAHIVKKYTSTERDYINEDLISVGTIGLIKAVDSFDIERGLVGEVRAVSMAEARVQEAAKLGFERCILPEVNRRQLDLDQMDLKGLKLVGISNVYELLEIL